MNDNDQKTLAKLIEIVEQISSGNRPLRMVAGDIERSDNPLLNELSDKLALLTNQYEECFQFILDLSRGKLKTTIPLRNLFANPYKQLHSELRYLTWQIKEISDGDYDQQVYFSGDFSYAINKMVIALRERQVLADKLKESNATKDKLFAIIAHDLRNPFNTIINSSELLMQLIDMESYDEAKLCAGMINDSATHTYSLLMNLLEWSRLQTGRITVNAMEVDLRFIIVSNIQIANLTAEPKNIRILFDDNAHYPIVADGAILNTILRNIIGNAIKYTPENGTITITIDRNEGFHSISVTDSGVGIPEERMKDLFRLDSIQSTPGTNKENGTGLGLVLCRDFVHLIGGDITVQSQPGKGSTFTFTVPDAI